MKQDDEVQSGPLRALIARWREEAARGRAELWALGGLPINYAATSATILSTERCADELEALLAAHVASTWQPISTAPKDGTVIDVWLGEVDDEDAQFYCTKGSRRSCGWHWQQGRFRPVMGLQMAVVTVRPTHWMPLPSAPVASTEEPK